jgi:CRISPR-associated endonuclease/helicase Cas3
MLDAHTPAEGSAIYHKLNDHLIDVAKMAQSFACLFGAGEVAYWNGLWHDLGKCNPVFQDYLHGKLEKGEPHAIWGAALAYELLRDTSIWKVLALPIYGHHTGLVDGGQIGQMLLLFLQERPEAKIAMLDLLKTLPSPPTFSHKRITEMTMHQRELFIRMLFSTLVDADYLDTERHFNKKRFEARNQWPDISVLWRRLEKSQQELIANAKPTLVNHIRRDVYEACCKKALGEQGVYRLTVPTGGGKTRSGLAFGLKHAEYHNLKRVIVAVPYTSIIDQTVTDYRRAIGDDAVLEHHSQVVVPENESKNPKQVLLQLSTENWDAPVVVTTTVQLFESLFTNKPGRARKLHNLAHSVVLIDEVQTLPPRLLEPTMDVLRDLVKQYGVTVILCTATQPTFEAIEYLKTFQGVHVSEIVPEYPQHFAQLQRVNYSFKPDPITWTEVANALQAYDQVMVVVNTRQDALDLAKAVGKGKHVQHLSTRLCGAHRKKVLADVKKRLDRKHPQRICLISTQVVEAGVDLDFPVVWRAIGPLDRIVQAAGRCNREGLQDKGDVVIFKPVSGKAPGGAYRIGLLEAQHILSQTNPDELHNPMIYHWYFQNLYTKANLDEADIQSLRADLKYPDVARAYRLIEDTVPIIVDYQDSLKYLQKWKQEPSRKTWRALQPYIVNVFEEELKRPDMRDHLEPVNEHIYRWLGEYDSESLGLLPSVLDLADYVV